MQVLLPPQKFENPTIVVFESSIKGNNDSYKLQVCIRSFTVPNFVCLSATIHELPSKKKNCMQILKLNRPPCFYFWVFTKVVLLKVVPPLMICQHATFHGPTLSGASFLSTSEV
jgi:hypothetical protein